MKKPSPRKVSKPSATRARATVKRSKAPSRPAKAAAPKRAAKALITAPAPATPRHRHAVFIDVENTSSEELLFDVLEQVHIDRRAEVVQVTAVGNWRVASQRLGRRLAGLGAELRHSAPATGVRDWSDLWIAVAAGYWLGRAEPGDVLEIVSNDRAFDAVGDTAALLGVTYRRLQLKRGAAAPREVEDEGEKDAMAPKRRRSRGGRRRRGRGPGAARPPAPVAASAAPPPRPAAPQRQPHMVEAEPHGATRDQIMGVIGRLTNGDPGRWVNLDVLEKTLKTEGFARPPGSPRLVTRLRMLKEVEVDSHGRVHLRHAPPAPEPEPAVEPEPKARAAGKKAAPKRRRRKRKAESDAAGDDAAPAEAAASPGASAAYDDPPAE